MVTTDGGLRMNKVLEDKLFKKYPKMFKQEDLETHMCLSISVGSGWFWILDNLCNCIQNYINANRLQQVEAVQVKEKFAQMRFYVNNSNPTIDGMIRLAEAISYVTCEKCGSIEDIVHTSGWVKTLCGECARRE